jgi:hypothetical protein
MQNKQINNSTTIISKVKNPRRIKCEGECRELFQRNEIKKLDVSGFCLRRLYKKDIINVCHNCFWFAINEEKNENGGYY